MLKGDPGEWFEGRFTEQNGIVRQLRSVVSDSRSKVEGPKKPSEERDSPITRPRCAHSANYCTTMRVGSCAEHKRICIESFWRVSQNGPWSHVDRNEGKGDLISGFISEEILRPNQAIIYLILHFSMLLCLRNRIFDKVWRNPWRTESQP